MEYVLQVIGQFLALEEVSRLRRNRVVTRKIGAWLAGNPLLAVAALHFEEHVVTAGHVENDEKPPGTVRVVPGCNFTMLFLLLRRWKQNRGWLFLLHGSLSLKDVLLAYAHLLLLLLEAFGDLDLFLRLLLLHDRSRWLAKCGLDVSRLRSWWRKVDVGHF